MGPRLAFVLHNGQILVVPGLRGHPGGGLTSLSSAGRGGICAGGRQRAASAPGPGLAAPQSSRPRPALAARRPPMLRIPGTCHARSQAGKACEGRRALRALLGRNPRVPRGRVEGGAGTFSRPRCRPRPPPQESAPRFVSFCFVPVALRGSTPCVASQCGSGFVSGLLPFPSGCPSHVSGCGVAPAFPTLRYQNCGFKSYNFIYYLTKKNNK